MFEGTILHFDCRTTSPFHTTRQRYANLVKCAPFILGTTLRGAVLNHLIRTRCPPERLARLDTLDDPAAVAAEHRACSEDCPVRHFFGEPSLIRFSFAEFDPGEIDYRMMTRIGMSRETSSVVEGSIFTIEAVNPGVSFQFEIILLEQAREIAEIVKGTVEQVAELGGIGGFRSIGLGGFQLLGEPGRFLLNDRLEQRMRGWPRPGDRTTLTFTTPFVLGVDETAELANGQTMAQHLAEQVDRTAAQAGYQVEGAVPLEQVDVRMRPDFVSRFSFERGLRENRLVAWPESTFGFEWPDGVDEDGLALALALGIGEWSEWGFGRFKLESERA